MTIFKQLRKNGLILRHAPHPPGTPILDVAQVSVRYNGHTALQDVSFRLDPGESASVVGPNGAGKSTLFKVISGVLPPTSGQVQVFGGGPGKHLCIAYLPQRSQVDWNFPATVSDVVMMGRIGKLGLLRWPGKQDWEFVNRCLDTVGLSHLAKRQIGELSGGQQQRMFIARALAQEAELMLMDEPFTGLDAPSQENIFQIIAELRRRGVTVMVAMHDLKLAAQNFTRILVLNHRLLGFGPPEEVLTPERLRIAYGNHLHLIEDGASLLALSDTCCDDGH